MNTSFFTSQYMASRFCNRSHVRVSLNRAQLQLHLECLCPIGPHFHSCSNKLGFTRGIDGLVAPSLAACDRFNLRSPVASEITLRLWWTSWSIRVLQQQSRTLKTMEDGAHSVVDECFEKSKVRLVEVSIDTACYS